VLKSVWLAPDDAAAPRWDDDRIREFLAKFSNKSDGRTASQLLQSVSGAYD
jgi:hypothetical protein